MNFFNKYQITIHAENPQDLILIKENLLKLRKILKEVTSELTIKSKYVVSLNLKNSKQIKLLNLEFRKIDKTTDVLSFPQNELFQGILDLGDIFINSEIIESQAKSIDSDINTELCFLFMHGLLHLIGYDHLKELDEKKMIKRQKEIFIKLGIRND